MHLHTEKHKHALLTFTAPLKFRDVSLLKSILGVFLLRSTSDEWFCRVTEVHQAWY